MELKVVRDPHVVHRYLELREPVLRARFSEGEEHGLEQRTPLIPSNEFLRSYIETTDLEVEPVDESVRITAIS